MATQSAYEVIEAAPDFVSACAYLYDWSQNYDHRNAPFPVFLDLIGYAQEHWGSKCSAWTITDCDGLDYMGSHALAKALMEWADRPHDVEEWLTVLLTAEMEGDE